MTQDAMTQIERADRAYQGAITLVAPTGRMLWMSDGRGGLLGLDRSQLEARWLARGLRLLMAGPLPSGARAIKVHTTQTVYWLSRGALADQGDEIRIADLFHPERDVRLPYAVAETVAHLLEPLASDASSHTGGEPTLLPEG